MSNLPSRKRSLDDLKAAFSNQTKASTNAEWKSYYPFWKAEDQTTSIVRFLPDLDPENSLQFLHEVHQHELIINGKKKTVTCAAHHGDGNCPICDQARAFYDAGDEVKGKQFYRKKSYIGQVLVIDGAVPPENDRLVQLIQFGPAVFKQIMAAFGSGDLEEAPHELKGGYNFRIKKTKSGQYASYTTSSFAPKQTDLDDELIAKLAPELYNLSEQVAPVLPASQLKVYLDAALHRGPAAEEEHVEPVVAPTGTPVATEGPKDVLALLKARAAANLQAKSE